MINLKAFESSNDRAERDLSEGHGFISQDAYILINVYLSEYIEIN